MTIQDAYNKGLTDAEENIIRELKKAINGEQMQPFQNPELEKVAQIIQEWSDYCYKQSKKLTTFGKYHNKMLKRQRDVLTS